MPHYHTMMATSARAFAYPDDVVVVDPVTPPVVEIPALPVVEDAIVLPETKVDETKVEEPKVEAKAEDEVVAPAVPEVYELKAPGDVALDAKMVEQATPVFKELGLTNEAAQKVVDFYAGTVLPEVAQTVQDATLKALGMSDMADWAKQLKADKELGGANFEKAATVAAQARDAVGTPELIKLLNDTRLGNHPEIFRLFHKIGTAIGEGSIFGKSDGTAQPASLAMSLYGEAFAPKS